MGTQSATLLNDTHSRLNEVEVARVERPDTNEELARLIRDTKMPVSVAGGRHAMGGQQFAEHSLHIDTRNLDRVLELDTHRGLVTAEAGIQWPALICGIHKCTPTGATAWGIRQKQTGASDMTLGGSLSANVHGRGLDFGPIAHDVECFNLITAQGDTVRCSLEENADLFRHAIGGYGLFGVITQVTLRLAPRCKVRRVVDLIDTDDVEARLATERAQGTLFGDFQYDIDHSADTFLRRGVFSRYQPVPIDTPIPGDQRYFTEALWLELLRLARTRKAEAFDRYADYYASTSGQIYWSDTHQLSTYVPGYHEQLGDLPANARGTEMITELYVPWNAFVRFMSAAADTIRAQRTPITYGTVRNIRRDTVTALPWASQDHACVIFNVLTQHTEAGVERTRSVCRALIDLALDAGGSYYLTYHRWARADQIRRAYPGIDAFLQAKLAHDPEERFQSEWYRTLKRKLAGGDE